MTQVFDEEGKAVPVTVIQAGPCVVVNIRTPERDGYAALQIGHEEVRLDRLNRPMRGQFEKRKVKPQRFLREVRVDAADLTEFAVGQEIKVDVFSAGDYVDVRGTSKGKGFAGGIKRHGMSRGPMQHGSKYHRRPGSLGAKGPARVFKGRKLPGRMGGETVSVQHLKIVKVDTGRNLLLLRGAVPGCRSGLILIRDSLR
jgi:large subunit ribosomal protein L3